MEMDMKLSGLKLSAAKQPANVGEEQVRRNKIVKRLVEQRELATAVAAGAERVNDFATPGFINSVCIWLLSGLFLFLGWWIDPYRARQGFLARSDAFKSVGRCVKSSIQCRLSSGEQCLRLAIVHALRGHVTDA